MKVVFETESGTQYDLDSNLGWICDYPSDMSAPSLRTNYKTIPARNGVLDLTEIDGNLYYDDIEFTITAQKICRNSTQIFTATRQIMNLFHGQRVKVILNNDTYYYDARLQVTELTAEGLVCLCSINVKAFPYRLQYTPTVVSATLSGTAQTITLNNGTMQVVPSISCSANMTMVFEDYEFTIASGSNIKLPNFVLHSGANSVQVTGTGTITFTYTQGVF